MTKNLSTKQVVTRIAIIIAAAELLIMMILGMMPIDLHSNTAALLDTVLLSIFSTPFIYLWVIKPFVDVHKELAFNDPLTRLPNRRMILQSIEQFIANCSRHKIHGALMMMDLNDFKSINDNHGHDAGDAVLIEVANRLKTHTRPEDVVGRLGGDEFIILLTQLDNRGPSIQDSVRQITKKLQDAIAEPILYKGKKLLTDSSIGICLSEMGDLSVKTSIIKADSAMYQAKEGNKKFAIYSEEQAETTASVQNPL